MQTVFQRAVDMLRRGRSPFDVGQALGFSYADVIDDAEQFVAEQRQNAANTAVTMLRAGAKQTEVLKALREIGLPQYDADEMTLHAMAAVRQEKDSA